MDVKIRKFSEKVIERRKTCIKRSKERGSGGDEDEEDIREKRELEKRQIIQQE